MKQKVKIAIERLQMFEPPEGLYLAFSGGKDSQAIYHLAKEAGVKFDSHFNFTTVDPPEVLKFIKENYPDVEWHRPKMSMFQLIVAHGAPPTSQMPYCCEELKEQGGIGRIVVTGIRTGESRNRANRILISHCQSLGKTFLCPILDWTESDVWGYLNSRGISHCQLYDEGYRRIGCIMCAKKTPLQKCIDAIRYPKYYKAYMNSFGKMIKRRKDTGKECSWETPEDVWNWWIKNYDMGRAEKINDAKLAQIRMEL